MKLKPISHFVRTHTKMCPCPIIHTNLVEREVRVQKLDEVNQRIVTELQTKTFNRAEEMKPYKVSDFCLENLIAIGAKLEPTTLQGSANQVISDIATTLASMPQPTETAE